MEKEFEKLEESLYEDSIINMQTQSLTIDVNIVVKDLFKYIKLKCTQKIRIMDIIALVLSIFSIILSVLLTVMAGGNKISPELLKLLFAGTIIKDITIVLTLVISLIMIGYELKYLIKQNKKFKEFYQENPNFTPEELAAKLMDINNIFNFKNWNEISFHIRYYKKHKSFKRHSVLIAILQYYKLPINKWNLMYLKQSIKCLNKKQNYHILRLIGFITVAIIMIAIISFFPSIFLQ